MKNVSYLNRSFLQSILFFLTFFMFISAADCKAQKGGKGRYRTVSVKKDARSNGYKIITDGNKVFFEADNVVDPITKKLLEGLQRLSFRCKEGDPPIETPLSFSAGKSNRIAVSCPILIEPQIVLIGADPEDG